MVISARTGGVLDAAHRYLAADAAAWRIAPGTAAIIAALPVIVAGFVAAARLSRPLSGFLTEEGSVLEWTQVVFLAIAAVAFTSCGVRLLRAGERLWAAVMAAGAVVALLVIGEELSWGQQATNLHLVRDAIRTINFLMIFAAGGVVLLSLAIARRRRSGRHAADLLVPPLALVPAFAIPFAYRSVRLITDGGASGPFSEMSELSLYYGIAMFAVLLVRRLGARPTR